MATPNNNLPRVTGILAAAGLIDTQWFTENACDRGTAVHRACQYFDEGALDWSTVGPEIEGYVRAYGQWRQDSGLTMEGWIECPMKDPRGLYCGTADRILTARPRWLVDLKTGGHFPWHALQLAAYVNMLPDPYSYRRLTVYLAADGKYTVKEYPRAEYAADLAVFMSALNVANFKRRHGYE